MKAMVLAAGMGERMRPLTETRAKPSLPLVNRSIIAHTLGYLKNHGVDEMVVNLHYQPESIRALIGDGRRLGVKVHFSDEQTILGTAGGLKKAESHFRDAGTFVMINCDFATDADLTAVIEEHRRSGAVATMVLAPRREGTDYSPVVMDGDGRIVSIGSPTRDGSGQSFIFTGIHILEPQVFDAIPPGVKYEINREVYPVLMQKGSLIRGYVHQGFWREMGSPRLYLEGNLELLGRMSDPALDAIRQTEGVYIDHVTPPPTVVASPPLLIGKGSTVGAHCSFQGGVIVGKQCQIGQSCALRSTVLWDGARIGDRAQLTSCIVTSGVYVPPMTILSGRVLFRVEGYQGRKDNLERVGSAWAAHLI
ncbi:MAG TPA: NDP-sugar synthase [Candidatus Polarisedimenticolia bacterium]|nr:NDP-sugar synthase [Candidatus Polarisedimenticolia bacterium]